MKDKLFLVKLKFPQYFMIVKLIFLKKKFFFIDLDRNCYSMTEVHFDPIVTQIIYISYTIVYI